jgi:organic radical activating enzyme
MDTLMKTKLNIHRLGLIVTLKCTLKCKICNVYAPYYSPVPHYAYDMLIDYIDRSFQIFESVDIFSISGGEPLLHEKLPEILDYLCQYRDRISNRLEVITNGTILPDNTLLKSMIKSGVSVLLDDYGTDLSKKAKNIAAKLGEHGIKYELRTQNREDMHFGGWVDLSEFSVEPKSIEDTKWLFDNCMLANELRCHPIIDGKIFVCSPYRRLHSLGKIPDNPKEYFDLFDDSLTLEEKKSCFAEFLALDNLSACAYCRGFLHDSPRFTPAEQLP